MGTSIDYTGHTLDGRYQLIRLLGAGGMGSVYLGRHSVIGRKLAVKFLHAEFATSAEVLKRFYREAQAAAAIGSKNIIEVLDVGATPQGDPYIVMEYLEGEDLESMLNRLGKLDLAAACGVLEPVLKGLGAAHEKGIVHRDLKPANIFITQVEGEGPAVKLIDFGISKFMDTSDKTKLTQTGSLIGTPAYMSPEQARGVGDIDHRTDLYAVGVILYQMLTGELPFKGESANDLLVKVLIDEPTPPSVYVPEIGREVEAVVMRALAKDPAARFQDVGEILQTLEQLAEYSKRRDSFNVLASGITVRNFAGGDLGSKIAEHGGPASATDVLAELAAGGTPAAWAGTAVQKEKRRRRMLLGIVGVALALIVGLVVALVAVLGGREPAVSVAPTLAPPPQPAAYQEPDQGVQISVVGAPEGARVFWDGAPVPMNPFRVRQAQTLIQLRVEAEGFEPYISAVIPEQDLEVEVAMKPAPEGDGQLESTEAVGKVAGSAKGKKKRQNGDGPAAETQAEATSETATPNKKVVITETPPPAQQKKEPPKKGKKDTAGDPKKKISEGGKGTLFSEDFD